VARLCLNILDKCIFLLWLLTAMKVVVNLPGSFHLWSSLRVVFRLCQLCSTRMSSSRDVCRDAAGSKSVSNSNIHLSKYHHDGQCCVSCTHTYTLRRLSLLPGTKDLHRKASLNRDNDLGLIPIKGFKLLELSIFLTTESHPRMQRGDTPEASSLIVVLQDGRGTFCC